MLTHLSTPIMESWIQSVVQTVLTALNLLNAMAEERQNPVNARLLQGYVYGSTETDVSARRHLLAVPQAIGFGQQQLGKRPTSLLRGFCIPKRQQDIRRERLTSRSACFESSINVVYCTRSARNIRQTDGDIKHTFDMQSTCSPRTNATQHNRNTFNKARKQRSPNA